MTDNEILSLRNYASRCFRRKTYGVYNYLDFEDYLQDFLLCALEHPNYSLALVASTLIFAQKRAPEKRLIENPVSFSAITDEDGELLPLYTEKLASFDSYFLDTNPIVNAVALCVYPNKPECCEKLVSFLYGETTAPQLARNLRDVLFRHRFEILDCLLALGNLHYDDYIYYKTIAENLQNRPKLVRVRKQTSDCVANRKAYAKRKAGQIVDAPTDNI